jgi:hypothetical protein
MATKPIFSDVPEWPEQSAAPAPKGHNRPPLEETIPAEFRETLLADRPDFLAKLDDLLGRDGVDEENEENAEVAKGAVNRAYCTDDASLAKCASLVNTLRLCEKHVDATHTAVKAPYLLGGRLVDGQKNALVQRIITGRQIVEGLQQSYARERQRIANEERAKAEAERQRIEAERRRLEELARENNIEPAALPPLPEPEPEPVKAAPIRSDDGATVSTSVILVPIVVDYAKAFKSVRHDAKVKEAIDAATARLAKATKATELPGVEFREEIKVNNR